jgi:hypothetical protein
MEDEKRMGEGLSKPALVEMSTDDDGEGRKISSFY